jgi:hypothetical protein
MDIRQRVGVPAVNDPKDRGVISLSARVSIDCRTAQFPLAHDVDGSQMPVAQLADGHHGLRSLIGTDAANLLFNLPLLKE